MKLDRLLKLISLNEFVEVVKVGIVESGEWTYCGKVGELKIGSEHLNSNVVHYFEVEKGIGIWIESEQS